MTIKLKPAGKLMVIAAVVTVAGIVSVRWYQARPKEVQQFGRTWVK